MAEIHQLEDNTPQKRGVRWRSCCVLLVLAGIPILLLMLLIANQSKSKPLRISKKTTYITEPLKSGRTQVDYFAAIEQKTYPDNIATDENGYRLLVRHLGILSDSEPWYVEEVCRKLGINAGALQPDITYEEPDDFLMAYVESEEYDETIVAGFRQEDSDYPSMDESASNEVFMMENGAGAQFGVLNGDSFSFQENEHEPAPWYVLSEKIYQGPWTLEKLPMMERWLEMNSSALDLVAEAVQKPTFHIPLARKSEGDLLIRMFWGEFVTVRAFARGLCVRANHRIATGNIDGAIDDIVACKRLGRCLGYGTTTSYFSIGIAIEGMAEGVGIASLLEHPPTKERLQRLMHELDDLRPVATLDGKMLYTRCAGLDVLQWMSRGGTLPDDYWGDLAEPMRYLIALSYDWNIVAKRLIDHYDTRLETGVVPSEPSLRSAAFVSRGARSKVMADLLGSRFVHNLAENMVTRRNQCVEHMRRIILAMLLYECDHGWLPPAYSVDEDGKPLHSWRVLLLPYLGQEELYKEIRLDEPWDSQHNQRFHGEEVAFYRCPSVSTAQPGETTYSVIVGPEMPFEAGVGKRLTNFGPESEDMILLVERAAAVCWMQPTPEIPQAEADAWTNERHTADDWMVLSTTGIGMPHPGGANFGLRNGSIRFFSMMMLPEVFRGLLRGTNAVDNY